MNFSEAIEKLKSGHKITRELWRDDCYFFISDGKFKAMAYSWDYYRYDTSILLSEDWIISDMPGRHNFSFMLDATMNGHHAKLEDWDSQYICFDTSEKVLVFKSMNEYDHHFVMKDFLSNDWVIVE